MLILNILHHCFKEKSLLYPVSLQLSANATPSLPSPSHPHPLLSLPPAPTPSLFLSLALFSLSSCLECLILRAFLLFTLPNHDFLVFSCNSVYPSCQTPYMLLYALTLYYIYNLSLYVALDVEQVILINLIYLCVICLSCI